MSKFVVAAAFAAISLVAGVADASVVTFTTQNKITTGSIIPSAPNSCGTVSPALAVVPASSTSAASQVTCGNSTSIIYDYVNGSKDCRFSLSSFYTPANPVTGVAAFWTPSANGITRGAATAICTAKTTVIGPNGNFTFATTMQ